MKFSFTLTKDLSHLRSHEYNGYQAIMECPFPDFLLFIILGFAKTVFWGKTNHWENILCIDETKLDIFGSLCPVTAL